MKPTFLFRISDILMFIAFVGIYVSLFVGLYNPIIGAPIFVCSFYLGMMTDLANQDKKESCN